MATLKFSDTRKAGSMNTLLPSFGLSDNSIRKPACSKTAPELVEGLTLLTVPVALSVTSHDRSALLQLAEKAPAAGAPFVICVAVTLASNSPFCDVAL